MKTVIVLFALVAVATAMQPFYHPQEQFPMVEIMPINTLDNRQLPKILESLVGLVDGFLNVFEATRRGDPVDRENMRQLSFLLTLLPSIVDTVYRIFGQPT
ncbi:AGAP009369-PA [Anopheles gambiae str. PEST]|uniref:AGAP009369-PA n=4 Tax=gambiae species complex TaxID=44542 RepID=A0NC59_ANOGA|nr:AgAcp34A-1 [Anopheles gambiae]AER11496.1 AgAcp34A-1 [Anopheles arabiensis]AER11506.1 AgAcp34A-1 [Anopheles melas]EAU77430.1 AGAP009369-PA [Anopheles gambiae str. PEST]AER11493.1 AgAcp34A-1 [Anopheles gambiae]